MPGAIKQFQDDLLYLGFPLPQHGADDMWGGETQGAMNAFQQAWQIPATALPNKKTIDTMNLLTDIPYTVDLSSLLSDIKAQQDSGQIQPTPIPSTMQPIYEPAKEKGFPWWGWLLIGLGATALVGGSIWVYYRYIRKPSRGGVSDLGDPEGSEESDEYLGCPTCLAGHKRKPRYKWGKSRA